MKIEKLPSGNYRVRKMINGKSHSMIFDHKPTQNEIILEINKQMNSSVTMNNAPRKSFKACALKYIEVKENVLSGSTKRSYDSIIRNLDSDFSSMMLSDIDQLTLQELINNLSVNHSPKTVRNYFSFISAVIEMFIPNIQFNVTLPKPIKKDVEEDYIPTNEEVKAIIDASTEKYKIVFTLACYGLRRSEVLALELDDIKEDSIRVNKAKILERNNIWVIQHYNKTFDSNRIVPVSPKLNLKERIDKQGYVFKGHPDKIYEYLHSKQKQLGIHSFRLHDLRHYFATEMNHANFTSKDIMRMGGWSSDYVLKRVYEHDRISKDKALQNKAANLIGDNLL